MERRLVAIVLVVAVGVSFAAGMHLNEVLRGGGVRFKVENRFGGGTEPDLSSEVNPENYQGDMFSGEITNRDVPEGAYGREVVYDENCHDVGGGLTGCNGGIRTQEFGPIDFYYEHDMDAKPCLAAPQREVLVVWENETFVQRKR